MNLQDKWEKAVKTTEIIRPRVQPLHTYETTRVPYIFLSESPAGGSLTNVRRGEVLVERPAIVLPFNLPQFEGFEFEEKMDVSEEFLKSFFLVRGISFPSMKFNNKTGPAETYEGRLPAAINHFSSLLQKTEDVATGLVTGSGDCWQFSVLLFIGGQAVRSAETDVRRLYDDFRGNSLS